eukprot:769999-Alexandrium_andersonii.AAC.1
MAHPVLRKGRLCDDSVDQAVASVRRLGLAKDTSETTLTVLVIKDRDSSCDHGAPGVAQGTTAR